MTASPVSDYDKIYGIVRNGYTGDPTIWDQTYDYIRLHPNELFLVKAPRKWSIGHQIVFHGALKLLQKLLPLYSEKNPIDITSLTNDTPSRKTILDIAKERQGYYREQYEYIEHLFTLDKFNKVCKAYNWPVIDDMLKKEPRLLNEKPPYCPNYFIHYLVIYGDIRKFAEYNEPDYKFQFDLRNADKKTALELAKDLKNQAVVEELLSLIPPPGQTPAPPPSNQENWRDDERETEPKTSPNSITPSTHNTRASTAATAAKPVVITPEILRKITCPLAKKIFVDPVVATDGRTYEHRAIADYVRDCRYSPVTGEVIDDTLYPDNQMKSFIETLRKQNLIK